MSSRGCLANRMKSTPEFIRFCLIGGMNTGVDFAVFTTLSFLNVPLLMAQTFSYGCGVLNSFIWNRAWTFKKKASPTSCVLKAERASSAMRFQFLRFVALNLLTLTVTYGFIIEFQSLLQWPLLLSKLIATGLSLGINFAGSRLWVFRNSYNA